MEGIRNHRLSLLIAHQPTQQEKMAMQSQQFPHFVRNLYLLPALTNYGRQLRAYITNEVALSDTRKPLITITCAQGFAKLGYDQQFIFIQLL